MLLALPDMIMESWKTRMKPVSDMIVELGKCKPAALQYPMKWLCKVPRVSGNIPSKNIRESW